MSEVLKRNFYITNSGVREEAILKYTMDLVGADRMMWAIDYPYEDSAASVAFMDECDISTASKDKIYHLNAEKLFRLSAK